jgi:pimeloyl-ACP methyl ester carboxylesterase
MNGLWHSAFTVMGQSFLMDLEVSTAKNEVFIINPELPGANKFSCDDVVMNKHSLSFTWRMGGLQFNGSYAEDGDSLYGKMSQSGLDWEVVFSRNLAVKKVVLRPQEPKSPFPYKTEEISFQNKQDGTQIFGTLTYPVDVKGSFPIVILASGSGPQDRDCNLLGHKPFLVIADHLARNGIASFRFDDRGTGQSKADYAKAGVSDFASDVWSSIDHFKTHKDFKKNPLGLIGHSEGGMHILLAEAKRKGKVDFMIFLASIATTGRQVLVQQQYEIPLKSGQNDSIARWNSSVFDGAAHRILSEGDYARCAMNLRAFLLNMAKKAPVGAIDTTQAGIEQFIMSTSNLLNNKWGREFLLFDAGAYIGKLNIPTLALFGGEDQQVNPQTNAAAFKIALNEKQKQRTRVEILDGLNHLFQKCNSCMVTEYGDLSETINTTVLKELVQFIQKQ